MNGTNRGIAVWLALMLLMLPGTPARAEGGAGALSLTVDRFRVAVGESPDVDVDLALSLNAGLDRAGGRGLLVLDASGAGASALTLIAALEGGKVKGYLRNAQGGLPYILEAPLEALAEAGRALLPMVPGVAGWDGAGPPDEWTAGAGALGAALGDPARREALRAGVLAAAEASLGLTEAGEAEVELFHQVQRARMYAGSTDFAGLMAALPEICAADPALKAAYDGAVAAIERSGALGSGASLADLPGRLAGTGNDVEIAITEYVAPGGQIRLEFLVTALERGEGVGTAAIVFDGGAGPDRWDAALSIDAGVPGAPERGAWLSLESSGARRADGEEGMFGLLVRARGDGGGTAAFQIETQRLDETASGPATDGALLSLALIPASDPTPYAASIRYDAEVRDRDGRPACDGAVSVECLVGGVSVARLAFDVLLEPTSLSDGPLLTADGFGALDVLEMTDEQAQALGEALSDLLAGGLGLLIQAPGMPELLGGLGM